MSLSDNADLALRTWARNLPVIPETNVPHEISIYSESQMVSVENASLRNWGQLKGIISLWNSIRDRSFLLECAEGAVVTTSSY